jgi:hypothetical protein
MRLADALPSRGRTSAPLVVRRCGPLHAPTPSRPVATRMLSSYARALGAAVRVSTLARPAGTRLLPARSLVSMASAATEEPVYSGQCFCKASHVQVTHVLHPRLTQRRSRLVTSLTTWPLVGRLRHAGGRTVNEGRERKGEREGSAPAGEEPCHLTLDHLGFGKLPEARLDLGVSAGKGKPIRSRPVCWRHSAAHPLKPSSQTPTLTMALLRVVRRLPGSRRAFPSVTAARAVC